MANDTKIYDGGCSNLHASDYAKLRNGKVYIKGSKFLNYDANCFPPDAARRLARYILELADDSSRQAAASYHAPTATAGRRVSGFFDALVDEGFGPELARQLTAAAAPAIVQQTYYDTEADAA